MFFSAFGADPGPLGLGIHRVKQILTTHCELSVLERDEELLTVRCEFPGGVCTCHRWTGRLLVRGAWAGSPWGPPGYSRTLSEQGDASVPRPSRLPGRCSGRERAPTCAVFAVLRGAEPAGPAQHPQVEGAPGKLEGRGRRLALDAAAEGTLARRARLRFPLQ